MPMDLLIIDDHSLFRTGLRVLLKQRLNAPTIHEAASTLEALEAPPQRLDLILLDIQMQGLNGLQSIGLLHQRWPGTPVVVLSSSLNPQDAQVALQSGAVAYLSKGDTEKKIVHVVTQAIAQMQSEGLADQSPGQKSTAPMTLTPRQFEVLGHICEGLSNKAIARRLQVSEFTVRGHVQAIFNTLQVTSRAQAIVAAQRLAWFE